MADYNVFLKNNRKLSGELIIIGDIDRSMQLNPPKEKTIVHAYMGGIDTDDVVLDAHCASKRHPVPIDSIANFGNPEAMLFFLGFFYKERGFNEKAEFPHADIVFAHKELIIRGEEPRFHTGISHNYGEPASTILSSYGKAFLKTNATFPDIPEVKGMLGGYSSKGRAVAAVEKLMLKFRKAVQDGNLEKAIECELNARSLLLQIK